jgi:hypothetical protein
LSLRKQAVQRPHWVPASGVSEGCFLFLVLFSAFLFEHFAVSTPRSCNLCLLLLFLLFHSLKIRCLWDLSTKKFLYDSESLSSSLSLQKKYEVAEADKNKKPVKTLLQETRTLEERHTNKMGTCSSTSLNVVSNGHSARFRIDLFHKISGSGPSRCNENILPVLYENFQIFKNILYQDQVGIEVLRRTQY